MNFEILREMEAFTQKMFNEIIGFQEKEHAAWDESKSFEERIKSIPLHYLMFSNADRDPETHGPTIAHYYPLHFEMAKIAAFAKCVSEKPIIYDVHARNGFVGSLLARENVDVIGLKDENEKPNQIENFINEQNYTMKNGSIRDINEPVDMIFSSWMPSGENLTEEIIRINPKLVAYIFTKHINEFSKERQTGVDDAFGEKLPENYKLIEEWSVTRPADLLHEVWPDLTGNIEETRFVKIYANTGFHDISVDESSLDLTGYNWEQDLLMAETALKAKGEMKQRGFPTQF